MGIGPKSATKRTVPQNLSGWYIYICDIHFLRSILAIEIHYIKQSIYTWMLNSFLGPRWPSRDGMTGTRIGTIWDQISGCSTSPGPWDLAPGKSPSCCLVAPAHPGGWTISQCVISDQRPDIKANFGVIFHHISNLCELHHHTLWVI